VHGVRVGTRRRWACALVAVVGTSVLGVGCSDDGESAGLCDAAKDLATTAVGKDISDPEVVAAIDRLADAADAELRDHEGQSSEDALEEGWDASLVLSTAESARTILYALDAEGAVWPLPSYSSTSIGNVGVDPADTTTSSSTTLPTDESVSTTTTTIPPGPESVEEALLSAVALGEQLSSACRLSIELIPEDELFD
jgi:hypothetical protein